MAVDPVSVGLLLAAAGGVGGAVGEHSWDALTTLVRRPFARSSGAGAAEVAELDDVSGLDELAALERAPADQEAAGRLALALQARAVTDPGFRAALADWQAQARATYSGTGYVHNEIGGGVQHGPVFQGRDFSGLTVGTNAAQPPRSSEENG